MSSWGSMRSDISWTADNIIYGLFLAEENVISRQETISHIILEYGLHGLPRLRLVVTLKDFSKMARSEEEFARIIKCVKLVAGYDTSDWVYYL